MIKKHNDDLDDQKLVTNNTKDNQVKVEIIEIDPNDDDNNKNTSAVEQKSNSDKTSIQTEKAQPIQQPTSTLSSKAKTIQNDDDYDDRYDNRDDDDDDDNEIDD